MNDALKVVIIVVASLAGIVLIALLVFLGSSASTPTYDGESCPHSCGHEAGSIGQAHVEPSWRILTVSLQCTSESCTACDPGYHAFLIASGMTTKESAWRVHFQMSRSSGSLRLVEDELGLQEHLGKSRAQIAEELQRAWGRRDQTFNPRVLDGPV